jgi:HJR/Mrr/RecB family endonuclease
MKLGKQTVINQQVKLGDLKDVRSGGEFEEYLTNLFSLLGYKTENTKITGDQGIDVLVSRGKERYGIQAKFYSQPVGNSAVQEVIAGREYFKLSKGIVVTNSTFTTSAKQLAEKTNVRLINGEELSKLIQMVKSGKTSGFVL